MKIILTVKLKVSTLKKFPLTKYLVIKLDGIFKRMMALGADHKLMHANLLHRHVLKLVLTNYLNRPCLLGKCEVHSAIPY